MADPIVVRLVGGPLCGATASGSQGAPEFAWVSTRGRIYRLPASTRFLYRLEEAVYLYAGHHYARCDGCGLYRRRSAALACPLCGPAAPR